MFKAEPLTPSVGALISGISLNNLGSDDVEQLYQALIKHQVIFLEIKS
jgi:taurine dioxygenase